MRNGRELRRVQLVVLLAVMLGLLLMLLTPHLTGHSGTALVFLLLVPVFLFGAVEIFGVVAAPANDAALSPAPVRVSLFQRPPPLLRK